MVANVFAADARMYYSTFDDYALDGKISANEYPNSYELTDVNSGNTFATLYWGHNNTHVFVGISGSFTGWVGFGMNEPGKGMAGADMVISSVENGNLTIGDYNAVGNVLPNKDDDQMPIKGAGTEENGVTTVEFIMPMASSDTAGQDHNWSPGNTYGFFVAAHESSDELLYHTYRTDPLTFELMKDSVSADPNDTKLGAKDSPFPITFISFLAVASVLVLIKKKKNQ